MARRVVRAARRVGALLLPCALTSAFGAAAPIPAQVAFAPPAEAKFQTYGKSEELILQGRILDAVTNACESTIRHRYYPPTIEGRSNRYDPWSDADRAIAQFADQLGAACRNIATRSSS